MDAGISLPNAVMHYFCMFLENMEVSCVIDTECHGQVRNV
jgi:hypothetical protein